MAAQEPEHFRVTYNDVHNLIRASAAKIAEFKPDMLIAIGAPAEWTNVQPGQNITVRVDRPVRNPPSISFNDS